MLPVAYSEGFSPHPKLHFGLALPTGGESFAEFLDADLSRSVDLEPLPALLSELLPVGIDVTAVGEIERSLGSLQESVVATRWVLSLSDLTAGETTSAIDRVMAADSVMLERVRKGTKSLDDVRGSIESAHRLDTGDVEVILATGGRSLRPAEFVHCLSPDRDPIETMTRALRTHQWIDANGERIEPLPVSLGHDALRSDRIMLPTEMAHHKRSSHDARSTGVSPPDTVVA